MRSAVTVLLAVCGAHAAPEDFGLAEVRRAMEARGIRPGMIRFQIDITADPPDSYQIYPGVVSGGDRRGLMYGLLEAAAQIRATGRIGVAKGQAFAAVRGVRWHVGAGGIDEARLQSAEAWPDFFAMLARHRWNRFQLVFGEAGRAAPPFPRWFTLPTFPSIAYDSLHGLQREGNLRSLRNVSQVAADHGIDFAFGLDSWEGDHSVLGLTSLNLAPYTQAALRRLVAECPAIRTVVMAAPAPVEFLQEAVLPALRSAGRLVALEFRGPALREDLVRAAIASGVPTRVVTGSGRLQAPHGPWLEKTVFPDPAKRPQPVLPSLPPVEKGVRHRPYDVLFEWPTQRLLPWADGDYVRRAVRVSTVSGAAGFEVDGPPDWQRYSMLYQLWGRLGYDPATKAATPAAMEGYQAASQVLTEVASLVDLPVSLETNPGGLLEAYAESTGIAGAIAARLAGRTWEGPAPPDVAARLMELAKAIRPVEPGLATLARLARFHAHRLLAASAWAWYAATGDARTLSDAEHDQRAAEAIWRQLDDPWRGMLPWLEHDTRTLARRSALQRAYPRFVCGFDFGPPPPARYAWQSVEARFKPVDTTTRFGEAQPFGWLEAGERSLVAGRLCPPADLLETPGCLPGDPLLDDAIRGRGRQTFRVAVPDGEYRVHWFSQRPTPQTTPLVARGGVLDVVTPDDEWTLAGIIVEGSVDLPPNPLVWPRLPARPKILHVPPKKALAGQPLTVSVSIAPPGSARTIRLRYGRLDHSAPLATIEAPAAKALFTIPGTAVQRNWDLSYFFEIVHAEGGVWREPDPRIALPFHVVSVEANDAFQP